MIKSIFQSKTMWVNAITMLIAGIDYFQGSDLIVNNPEVSALALIALAGLNMLLRKITKTAVAFKLH